MTSGVPASRGAPVTGIESKPAATLPKAGDRSADFRVYYGFPILQKSFFWDGNGENDEAGLKMRHLWHLTDDFAIGLGLTGSAWFIGGPDAFAAEGEAVGRYYAYRSEDLGVFAELTGGWIQSTRPIPVGGTEWNMTFSFGPGFEVPFDDRLNLLGGVTYHHVSNALGHENRRNPSQNEVQGWIGFSYRL
ncbi:MAG: hypothetical protein KDC98_10925 [Planctomycetes bacterium]|nr:hypothetical protein [Planctomycetota bacterium]